MERIAVVGSGGAGKSTFARELGGVTGLHVVHLDEYFWKPGWEQSESAERAEQQTDLFGGDRWIADGNYGGTFDPRFARADTVIIAAIAPSACVLSALKRSVKNRGQELQAPGCPERIDARFLRWIWRYPRDSRPRLDAALDRHPHLDIVELHTRDEISEFLGAPPR